MPEQVILDFVGDPSGLKPVYDALTALGQLTDQQQKDFAKANADYKKQMEANAAATKQTTTALLQMSTAAKGISQNIGGAAIKDGTENLKKFSKELVNAGKESTSLKSQLRAIKAELATMADEGSPEFQRLAIEAAKLEDKIGDVSERIRVLASDTFAIDAVVDGVRGLTAAFTVAQSASALFGKENEDVQKALLKVQAATGLLIGVQEIANQLTGQGAAKLAVLSAAQTVYGVVVGTTTGLLKAFRIALLGTGIGAIVFVLYEAAKAMGLFGDETNKVSEAIKKDTEITNENTKAHQANMVARINTLQTFTEAAEIIKNSGKKNFDEIKKLDKLIQDLTTQQIFTEFAILAEKDAQKLANLKAANQRMLDELKTFNNERLRLIREQDEPTRETISPLPTLPVIGPDQIAIDNKMLTDEEIKRLEKENLAELERLRKVAGAKELADAEKLANEKAAIKLQIEQAAFQAIGMIINEAYAQQQEQIQATLNAELNALNEQQQAILSNESLTASQKEAIQKQFEQKEKEAKRKAWIAERNSKVEQALINGLLSFSLALATIPPPGGAITGAINLALAGVQAALIASKPVPAFFEGSDYVPLGSNPKGRDTIPAMLHEGERVVPASINAKLRGIPNDMLPQLAMYANMMPSIPDSMMQQFERNQNSTLDYKMIGDTFADRLAKNPMLQVSIDKNGVSLLVTKGNRKVNYLNSKFKG